MMGSRFEKGKDSPSVWRCYRIAKIFNTTIERLLTENQVTDVVENYDDTHFSAYVDIGTQSRKFSVACDPTNAPADA